MYRSTVSFTNAKYRVIRYAKLVKVNFFLMGLKTNLHSYTSNSISDLEYLCRCWVALTRPNELSKSHARTLSETAVTSLISCSMFSALT